MPGLVHEAALKVELAGEVLVHHLERDRAPQARVVGTVDSPQDALAQQCLYAVLGNWFSL